MKKFLTGILLFAFPIVSIGKTEILPIDSIYLNTISKFYKDAKQAKNNIWPGMELSPVCLYRVNGPAILYNHPDPPELFHKIGENLFLGSQKELQFSGSTQVHINGLLTAIVNYGHEHFSNPEEVYAELFHELHHVYQRNNIATITYENPVNLLTYPEDITNDAIKLYEQTLLLKMAFAENKSEFENYLNKYYSTRKKREGIIGSEFIKYEKTVENIEGPAFYCEYRFFNDYGSSDKTFKENYNHARFWTLLNAPYYGRNNLRRRYISAGMAMCYILDKYFQQDWKKEYYSGDMDLFDFFVLKLKPQLVELPNLDVFFSLSKYHTPKLKAQRENELIRFTNQAGLKIVLEFKSFPRFRGFDPMNAISINDSTILHNNLLNLIKEDNNLIITKKEAATIVEKQIWFVRKVIFFVDKNADININNGKITISTNGINLEWAGEIISQEERKIIFSCE